MRINADKKIIEKTIIGVITMSLILSPSTLVWSGDYPAGYLGPGHREYLNNKIQNGYYVEVFTDLEGRQEERVNKRNQIEELVSNSYQANYDSAYGILKADYLISQNAQEINWTIQQNQNRTEETASNLTEFKYIKYSDGKIVNFKEGLPSSIENERVVDEFGNLSLKHTYNMEYNFDRLLTSYEADLKDNLGNITHIFCYGITYSPDSVFYGGYDTNANKNETEKYIKEIDPAGDVRLTHWLALSYEGKILHSYYQEIEDTFYGNSSFTRTNITYENDSRGHPTRQTSYHEEGVGTDGLEYSLDRTNITYNEKDQVTGYHEELTIIHDDGGKDEIITVAKFEYISVPHQFGPDVEVRDPDKLKYSQVEIVIKNPDGFWKREIETTNYIYDSTGTLTLAEGSSVLVQGDGQGNVESGSSTKTYELIRGRPEVVKVVTEIAPFTPTSTMLTNTMLRGTIMIIDDCIYMETEANGKIWVIYGPQVQELNLAQYEGKTITLFGDRQDNGMFELWDIGL